MRAIQCLNFIVFLFARFVKVHLRKMKDKKQGHSIFCKFLYFSRRSFVKNESLRRFLFRKDVPK